MERIKRYIRLCLYMLIYSLAIYLCVKGQIQYALPVILMIYLFLGLVSLGHILISLRLQDIGFLCINITIPYLLLSTERSYYLWLKATYYSSIKNDICKSIKYAEKVNPQDLSTLNDKSIFYSYKSSLYSITNNGEIALELIKKAIETPHKKILDDIYGQIYNEIQEKFKTN